MQKPREYKTLFLAIMLFLLAAPMAAQKKLESGPQVMILGTYHFANSNNDAVKTQYPDHLSQTKQAEIENVLNQLANYNPTKIVVEAIPGSKTIQKEYKDYLVGNYTLSANEIDQLGYRLAKRLGHKKVYGADNKLDMDFDGLMKAARDSNNKRFLSQFQKTLAQFQSMAARQIKLTVKESLIELNQPGLQTQTKDFYLQMAGVRNGSEFVGADVLAAWYKRNFRIFANISELVETENERVLVIFGQGHAPYLRELVKSSGNMKLVEPNSYLSKEL